MGTPNPYRPHISRRCPGDWTSSVRTAPHPAPEAASQRQARTRPCAAPVRALTVMLTFKIIYPWGQKKSIRLAVLLHNNGIKGKASLTSLLVQTSMVLLLNPHSMQNTAPFDKPARRTLQQISLT